MLVFERIGCMLVEILQGSDVSGEENTKQLNTVNPFCVEGEDD